MSVDDDSRHGNVSTPAHSPAFEQPCTGPDCQLHLRVSGGRLLLQLDIEEEGTFFDEALRLIEAAYVARDRHETFSDHLEMVPIKPQGETPVNHAGERRCRFFGVGIGGVGTFVDEDRITGCELHAKLGVDRTPLATCILALSSVRRNPGLHVTADDVQVEDCAFIDDVVDQGSPLAFMSVVAMTPLSIAQYPSHRYLQSWY